MSIRSLWRDAKLQHKPERIFEIHLLVLDYSSQVRGQEGVRAIRTFRSPRSAKRFHCLRGEPAHAGPTARWQALHQARGRRRSCCARRHDHFFPVDSSIPSASLSLSLLSLSLSQTACADAPLSSSLSSLSSPFVFFFLISRYSFYRFKTLQSFPSIFANPQKATAKEKSRSPSLAHTFSILSI